MKKTFPTLTTILFATALLAGPAHALLWEIEAGDWDGTMRVLDFEEPDGGYISATDPYFTDFGISSITIFGDVDEKEDRLNYKTDGNSLVSINTDFRVNPKVT